MGGRRRRGLADLIGEVGKAPLEREEEGPGAETVTTAGERERESPKGDGGGDRVFEERPGGRPGFTRPPHEPR